MQRDESAYLLDMLLEARAALEITSGLTHREFEQGNLHWRATLNAVQNIGEAASRIGAATRQAHPEIPWHRIVAFRNRVVHKYFEVDLDVLWRITQVELLELISQIEPLVPPEESG
ncbi:MAG: DUF86 domain-containing protein [Chloroflexi bacterium]|nr:DUF86 domain-containing protein [Chloroflexota bacterium]